MFGGSFSGGCVYDVLGCVEGVGGGGWYCGVCWYCGCVFCGVD